MITAHGLDEGAPGYAGCFVHSAWQELEEFQWGGDAESVCARIIRSTESNERIELIHRVDGVPAAIMILVVDDDPHVGVCLGVQWFYTLPAYRNQTPVRAMLRIARSVAADQGLSILAYTHRTGPAEYTIRYRRLHGQESNQDHHQDQEVH
jgi:hypothetical protein